MDYYNGFVFNLDENNSMWKDYYDSLGKESFGVYSVAQYFTKKLKELADNKLDKLFEIESSYISKLSENSLSLCEKGIKNWKEIYKDLLQQGEVCIIAIPGYLWEGSPQSSYSFVNNIAKKKVQLSNTLTITEYAELVEKLFILRFGKKPQDCTTDKVEFYIPGLQYAASENYVTSETASMSQTVNENILEELEIPVVEDPAIEGYFYVKDTGEYVGKNGTSKKCYAVQEKKDKYTNQDVIELKIKHDEFTYIPGVLIAEDPDSFESLAILTQTTFNAVKIKKGDSLDIENQAKYAAVLLKSPYSSVSNKIPLEDDNKDVSKMARKALIHVLTGGKDYSNGCIVWDGVDFLTKGKNHPKSKDYGGISITKSLWNSFVDVWFPNVESTVLFNNVIYSKNDCINNIPFLKENLTEEQKGIEITNIKNNCSNLYTVTTSLFETYKSEVRSGYPSCKDGKKEFKWILNKAERIVGKSIFWKADKARNKGYVWKNYFKDSWFV